MPAPWCYAMSLLQGLFRENSYRPCNIRYVRGMITVALVLCLGHCYTVEVPDGGGLETAGMPEECYFIDSDCHLHDQRLIQNLCR